jgi:hypothetical protein
VKSKHTSELTLQDLIQHPVWVAGVEDDWDWETFDPLGQVLPHTGPLPIDPAEDDYVVTCNFTLADGSTFQGYLAVDRSDDLGFVQPTIVTSRGRVDLWHGIFQPDATALRDKYSLLEREASDVFPIRFESAVPLVGGPVSGLVPGFLYLDSDTTTQGSVT